MPNLSDSLRATPSWAFTCVIFPCFPVPPVFPGAEDLLRRGPRVGPRYPVFPGAEYLEEAQERGLAVEKGGVLQGGLERGLPQAWHPCGLGGSGGPSLSPTAGSVTHPHVLPPVPQTLAVWCREGRPGCWMRPGLRLGEGQYPQAEVGWAAPREGVEASGGSRCWPPKRDETEGPLPAGVGKKEVNSRSF